MKQKGHRGEDLNPNLSTRLAHTLCSEISPQGTDLTAMPKGPVCSDDTSSSGSSTCSFTD